MKRIVSVLLCLLMALLLVGCVSSSRYDALLSERDALAAQCEELQASVSTMESRIGELENSAEELRAYIAGQTDEINELRDALNAAEGLSRDQQSKVDELLATLEKLQQEAVRFPLQQEWNEAVGSAARGVGELESLVSNFLSDLSAIQVPSLSVGNK